MPNAHAAEIIDITPFLARRRSALVTLGRDTARPAAAEPKSAHPVLELYDGDRYLGRIYGPGCERFYAWNDQWALIGLFQTEAQAITAVRARA